jgi:hypothetical protein
VAGRPATPASLLRRTLAEGIAPAYAAYPSVVAVLLGGSSARGHADEFSDLEVTVLWKSPPTDGDRAEAIAVVDGDLVRLYPVEHDTPGPVWSDAWHLGRKDDIAGTGIEVDMHHYLAGTIEQTIAEVVHDFDTDVGKHNLVGGLLHATPLHGEAYVAELQQRVSAYPDELRVAVVRAHAQIEGLWRLDAFAARDNPVAGYGVLVQAQQALLRTLLGLNGVYEPGFKWLEPLAADLELAPANLLDRLRACYPLRAGESREILTQLVEETYDLIETQLPDIDVVRLRTVLAYERPHW